MKYAFDVANFGPYADPRVLADLARRAEYAGWDGFFIWDHVQVSWPDAVGDTTVQLAAIAMATSRIRFGPMVTPLPRRHPWKLAREAATLDQLSNGRLILGIGLGGDWFKELSTFGYPLDDMTRAEMLDEGLAILTGLLSGEEFSFAGNHYKVAPTRFMPKPIQPRIPIWIAGTWPRPRPFRRAARFDGVVPMSMNIEKDLGIDDVRAIARFIREHREVNGAFDLLHAGDLTGKSKREAADIVAPFIEAGVTWWSEAPLPWKTTLEDVRARIANGPPLSF
ncbi:MAG TPA: LLM class flavin-dependent oxidoreductase [Candidatus Binataceae bacterium]|nr:LLM class flavin-dependent oxidoreductase [Candidatus Binataceae bacterium]